MSMAKQVVVTGGAGFLGTHLSNTLAAEGVIVHVIDNFATGKKEGLRSEVHVHEADVQDAEALDRIFTDIGDIAAVFHLAALPRVQFSIDFPLETHNTNVNGTLAVLLAARKHKVGRFIYSASSSAYGDQPILPLQEDMLPNPKSPYALQKHVGEHYCRIFSLAYGLPTVSLRYFNIYGPGADPNGPYAQAIIRFIDLRKQNKPMPITGTGEQTRDSVHVRDVVRANILAWKSEKVGNGEVINIGSGRSVSVNQVAGLIGGPVEYTPPRIEPMHTQADIRKAKDLLGWEPAIQVEEGIAELKKIYGLQ